MEKTIEKTEKTMEMEKLINMAEEVVVEMGAFPRPLSGVEQRTEDAINAVMALKRSGKLTPVMLKLALNMTGVMDSEEDDLYDFWNDEGAASIAIDAVWLDEAALRMEVKIVFRSEE